MALTEDDMKWIRATTNDLIIHRFQQRDWEDTERNMRYFIYFWFFLCGLVIGAGITAICVVNMG